MIALLSGLLVRCRMLVSLCSNRSRTMFEPLWVLSRVLWVTVLVTGFGMLLGLVTLYVVTVVVLMARHTPALALLLGIGKMPSVLTLVCWVLSWLPSISTYPCRVVVLSVILDVRATDVFAYSGLFKGNGGLRVPWGLLVTSPKDRAYCVLLTWA